MITDYNKFKLVAENLRDWIWENKIEPGTKLRNVRSLAKEFSVSTQSITSAFDILEKDLVIERHPRRGVFVRRSEPSNFEIGLFFDINSKTNPHVYQRKILKLTDEPYLESDFNYTIRMKVMDHSSESSEMFAREIGSFTRKNHFDCLVIIMPNMKSTDVKLCADLPIPVLCVGDFADANAFRGELPQVTGDMYLSGSNLFSSFHKLTGAKKVVLFLSTLHSFFYREFSEGMSDKAKELQCELEVTDVFSSVDLGRCPDEKLHELFCETLKKYSDGEYSDTFFFDASYSSALPAAVEITGFPYWEKCYTYIQNEFLPDSFYRALNRTIRIVIADPLYRRNVVCSAENNFKIIRTIDSDGAETGKYRKNS